jgi:hypothetical protein
LPPQLCFLVDHGKLAYPELTRSVNRTLTYFAADAAAGADAAAAG